MRLRSRIASGSRFKRIMPHPSPRTKPFADSANALQRPSGAIIRLCERRNGDIGVENQVDPACKRRIAFSQAVDFDRPDGRQPGTPNTRCRRPCSAPEAQARKRCARRHSMGEPRSKVRRRFSSRGALSAIDCNPIADSDENSGLRVPTGVRAQRRRFQGFP